MRRLLPFLVVTLALVLAACGGSSSGGSTQADTAATSASTGEQAATGGEATAATESEGAPCTKEALAAGAQSSFGKQEIEILGGYVCEGGWAAGPVLIGPSGSEEQIEAAFMLKAENGKWVVPTKLPCDDPDVPESVLNNSPCRVS